MSLVSVICFSSLEISTVTENILRRPYEESREPYVIYHKKEKKKFGIRQFGMNSTDDGRKSLLCRHERNMGRVQKCERVDEEQVTPSKRIL